ncbi:hypothetical protein SAMN05216474_3103 [Lishizhenia tianjinensis]|uniref:Uncharacterized protein n=2 Tax=Lishizhenia tianjinensis TaxID=477690 RepID=A0A1I7BUR0_9FLAO|nr:hypothetical protein SAMN05216474_3103 [Lishizhenia tianjinensis]
MLLCVNVYAQAQEKDKIKIKKKPTEVDFLPHINGVYDGEIAVEKICFGDGIKNNLGYQVFSFQITYVKEGTTVTEYIRSNQIPDTVCAQLQFFNLNQRIFITAIKALDHSGRLITLEPFSLIPIKEDE